MSKWQDFKEELQTRLQLSALIGRSVRLTRAGREMKGCCPFHHEKTPSFYVNDDKGFYHCFGCGAHGDALKFVMENEGLSFFEAADKLASEAGIAMPRPSSNQDREDNDRRSRLYALMEAAADWFARQLAQHKDIQLYLQNRGLSHRPQGDFQLGYAPSERNALQEHLRGKNFKDAEILAAGLAKQPDDGRPAYGFFRDRLIFPVRDIQGRVIAFGGRILPEDLRPRLPGENKPPKYLNSPDTEIFHKGRTLYGLYEARTRLKDQPPVVAEGYTDVIALHASDLAAVAPLGTALTEDQIRLLWSRMAADSDGLKAPILCFDGDSAGRMAAERALRRLLPILTPGHTAKFIFLPEGQDPDSLVADEGPGAFKALLATSVPLSEAIWMLLTDSRNLSTPEAQVKLKQDLLSICGEIQDPNVQESFRNTLINQYRDRFQKRHPWAGPYHSGKRPDLASAARVRRPAIETGTERRIKILLLCALNHPELLPKFESDLENLNIEGNKLGQLRGILLQFSAEMDPDTLDTGEATRHLNSLVKEQDLDQVLENDLLLLAPFAKKEAAESSVLQGWQDVVRGLHKTAIVHDYQSAHRAYRRDQTPESEERARRLGQVLWETCEDG